MARASAPQEIWTLPAIACAKFPLIAFNNSEVPYLSSVLDFVQLVIYSIVLGCILALGAIGVSLTFGSLGIPKPLGWVGTHLGIMLAVVLGVLGQ